MSITPGEFEHIAGADTPEALIETNFAVATRMLYQWEPTYVSGVPNEITGPPTTGSHELDELWRDQYGAEFTCTIAGTPGTWTQIKPAIVDSEPTTTLTDYWIIRRDQDWKHYRYTGSGYSEVFLSLSGGTMTGNLILNGDPSSPLQAATRAYVDALAGGGADPKDSCRAATNANVDLTTGGLLTIDTVTLEDGDRVLVKAQTAGEENGIYTASSGTWTRASDADSNSKMTSGMYCFVTEGTSNGDMGYILTTDGNITLGTTVLTFAQFSKGLADGECTDVKIGDRTLDQSLTSPANTGTLTDLLSWIVGRIKNITGKSDWKTAPDYSLEDLKGGKQTIWIPAHAMTSRYTNGANIDLQESATNYIMRSSLDFDANTNEYAQFIVAMPKSWDLGTVTASFIWTAASGSGNVVWGIQGLAVSDDDDIDSVFGTAQEVTDGYLTAYKLHRTTETSAVTLSGSVAMSDVAWFQVYRNAVNGTDTLTVDAQLLGVILIYQTETPNDN